MRKEMTSCPNCGCQYKPKADSYNPNVIRVTKAGEETLIPVSTVTYLKASDKYIEVKHDNGISVADGALVHYEKVMGDGFIRIHKNALVAVNRILGMKRNDEGGINIILDSNGSPVYLAISRRHQSTVRRFVRGLAKV